MRAITAEDAASVVQGMAQRPAIGGAVAGRWTLRCGSGGGGGSGLDAAAAEEAEAGRGGACAPP